MHHRITLNADCETVFLCGIQLEGSTLLINYVFMSVIKDTSIYNKTYHISNMNLIIYINIQLF